MNTTIKKWEDRTDDTTPGAMMVAMESEIYDLRAALAAREEQQEPVAEVFYKSGDYLDCREIRVIGSKAQFYANFPHGTKLYAAPVAQQSEAGAQDVARYRFLREHWVSFSAAPPLSNLHWKRGRLDAAVDAAMQKGAQHG